MKLGRFVDWPIQTQVLIGPLLLFVISLLLAGSAIYAMLQTRQTNADIEESYQFLTEVSQYSKAVVDLETGMRGYLLAQSPDFLEPYNNASIQIPYLLASLREHTNADPLQLQRLDSLEAQLSTWRQTIAEPRIDAVREGRPLNLTLDSYQQGKSLFDGMRATIDEIKASEEKILLERTVASQRAANTMAVGFGIILLMGAFSVLLVWLISRRIVGPIRLLGSAAGKVAQNDYEILLPEEGDNELGQTSRAFNQMVGALNEARAELQSQASVLEQQVQVAEQARSETDAVLNSVGDAIFLATANKKVLWVNKRTEEIFGVKLLSMNQLTEAEWVEAFAKVFADGEGMRALVINAFAHPNQQLSEIVQTRWPIPRQLSMFSVPVTSQAGINYGRVFVFRDVTKEREVDEMKHKFVSMVSHEFRTPLTSIKGYTDLLASGEVGELTDEQKEFLEIIQINGDRLMALVNNLLELSRLEQGRVDLREVTLEVAPLVQGALVTLHTHIDNKGQQLLLNLDNATPAVRGDAARITQILHNLLSNAHKFTPPGGTISVSAAEEGNFLRISVADTGIGLSAEEQAQLFDPFYRAQNPAAQNGEGTGLGLPIARMLVEMHGGEITVESAPAQGTTVSFTLPIAHDAKRASTQSRPDARMAELMNGAGALILVVEDEPDIAELNRWHLTRAGYQVLVADNALEGLVLAKAFTPALILLDVLLPGADGLTLLEWLKEDESTAEIPVLLLSVLPDDGKGRKLGAVDYLLKPVPSQLLLTHIQGIIAKKRSPLVLVGNSNESESALILSDLKRGGYRILTANTDAEVIQALDEHQPDLLVLDMQSPTLDSLEIYRTLRSKEQDTHLPVIFMVGTAEHESTFDLASLETFDHSEFLTKPFSAEDLANLIAQHRLTHIGVS